MPYAKQRAPDPEEKAPLLLRVILIATLAIVMVAVDYCIRALVWTDMFGNIFLNVLGLGVVSLGPIVIWGLRQWRNRRLPVWRYPHVIASLVGLTSLTLFYATIGFTIRRYRATQIENYQLHLKQNGWPTTLAKYQEDLPDSAYALPALRKLISDLDIERADSSAPFLDAPNSAVLAHAPTLRRSCKILDAGAFEHALGSASRLEREDFRRPTYESRPDTNKVRFFGPMLEECAALDAARGSGSASRAHVLSLLKMSDITASQHWVIEQVWSLLLERMAAQAALEPLARISNSRMPKSVVDAFHRRLEGLRMTEGMRTELAFQLDIARNNDGGYGGVIINCLTSAREFERLAGITDWPSSRATRTELIAEQQSLPAVPYIFAKLVSVETWFQMWRMEFETRNWLKLALTAGKLADYRASHGRYPNRLSDLPQGATDRGDDIDEFTGGEFFYEPVEDGYKLCSAGANGDRKQSNKRDLCVTAGRSMRR
jgi:hypothetical protein